MDKDPAFLFYSKDYYEGTRTMLPEERACYVDLMVYQHQNGGFVPNDIPRILMYCSGISEATLKATLKAKFKLCDKGWYNHKLKKVVDERERFSQKQSINGIVGQFWKRAKRDLSAKDLKNLRGLVSQFTSDNKDFLEDWISIHKEPKAMLQAMHKHLEDVNAIEIEDVNEEKEKRGSGKKTDGDVILPWDTQNFKAQWSHWKIFKSKEFGFKYKSIQSEQAALTELSNKANGDEKTAIAIIHQSMANGWKGFFQLKNNNNGNRNNNQPRTDAELKQSASNAVDQILG